MLRFLKEDYITKDLYFTSDRTIGEDTLIAVFFKMDGDVSEENLTILLELIYYGKIKNNNDLQVVAEELNLDDRWVDKYEKLLALKHNGNILYKEYMDFRMMVDNIIATMPDTCDSNSKQIRYLIQNKINQELYFINKEEYDIYKPYYNLLNSFHLGDSIQTNLRKVYLMVTHYANDIKDYVDLKILQQELSFNNEMYNNFDKLLELKQEYHLQNEIYTNARKNLIKYIVNKSFGIITNVTIR